jgi:tripartite-type tricarboxylate transporter receptor subunit TctC
MGKQQDDDKGEETFMRRVRRSGLLACCLVAGLASQAAYAQADFYKGKTVTIVVGTRVGGSIGNTSLIVSRHIGRHIPGNPTVILRQMPGGAHLNATNNVFNVAEADGLTILGSNPAIAMAQLAKVQAVRFDVRQFQWLGSTGPDGTLFAVRANLPYKSFKDLQASKEDIVVGSTGPGSNSHDVPMLLKEFAGAKFRLLAGFQANGDIRLALERGEVDGWSALATPVRQAAAAGTVRPLLRGRGAVKGFDHLPVDEELTPPGIGRSLMVIRGTPLAIGKPFAVRPGVPADRVAMLRDAFAKMVRDPQFLADAEKMQLEIDPLSAEQVTKDFASMMNQPPEAIEAMLKYIKLDGGG